ATSHPSSFHDTATTPIHTLSLHDALPISEPPSLRSSEHKVPTGQPCRASSSRFFILTLTKAHRRCFGESVLSNSSSSFRKRETRSEEHTSELQSLAYLVCRLLLEKKKRQQ